MVMALIRYLKILSSPMPLHENNFVPFVKSSEQLRNGRLVITPMKSGLDFTFLFGLPGFPRIKDVIAELDNCIGKAASVFITCQGLSVKLNDLLKKIDQGKTILKNPTEYGLDEGDKRYFKPLIKELYSETNRILVDVSNKMEPVKVQRMGDACERLCERPPKEKTRSPKDF